MQTIKSESLNLVSGKSCRGILCVDGQLSLVERLVARKNQVCGHSPSYCLSNYSERECARDDGRASFKFAGSQTRSHGCPSLPIPGLSLNLASGVRSTIHGEICSGNV